jgi:hypothetical protein
MSGEKYIGLDVHQATISVAVMDSQGKLIMESILETTASTILGFLAGLRGALSVTFEEGTCAAWLYDLLSSGQRHDPSVGSIQNSRFLLVLLFRLLDCLSELLDCGDLR